MPDLLFNIVILLLGLILYAALIQIWEKNDD